MNESDKELSPYPELLQMLLSNRGIKTRLEAEKFLNPSYENDLYDPFLMKDMEKAAVRIFEATEAKEKIMIYGDYDCDGIPGSVILHDFFKKIGYGNFDVYIPDRHEEGYGLHRKAIHRFIQDGIKLLITVDLGTSDIDEVTEAQAGGVDVIITDHHLPGPVLPPAYAILNPKQEGDAYPYDMLCGSGVAFKLVSALIKKYGEFWKIQDGWEKWLLDMAGLATLSDMVPLKDENHVIAHYGLKVLKKNKRIGLQKLLSKIKIDARHLSEDDITFMVTPKLNAASRMDSPLRAFELLSATDESVAGNLAHHLSKINDERKILVADIIQEVKKTMENREEKPVIVIGDPSWRIGILGLVASRLTEEYKKPAFVWGLEGGEIIKGSCRSDGSVNVVEIMRGLEENTLIDFGGHELAGGFSIAHEKIHFLEDGLASAYEKFKKGDWSGEKKSYVDKKMSLDDVTMKNYELIEKMAPFGVDNQKPAFLFEGIELDTVKLFGKGGEHLDLSFKKDDGKKIRAIKFFTKPESFAVPLAPGNKINLIATFEKSMFMNRPELRLRIVDIY